MQKPERWFNFVYFADSEIQSWLDAIVFFANPCEKNAAHITLRGPFRSKKKAENIPGQISGANISVLGTGTFFNDRQNTVFLKCGSDYLRKYWYKPDFAFNPHITLYDGESRDFARKLLETCNKHRLFMSLDAGQIEVVGSVRGQNSLSLQLGLSGDQIEKVLGQRVNFSQIPKMPDWQRLMIIERMLVHLTGLAKAHHSRRFETSSAVKNEPTTAETIPTRLH